MSSAIETRINTEQMSTWTVIQKGNALSESTPLPESESTDFIEEDQSQALERDLLLIQQRQLEWNDALHISDDSFYRIRNYNPVLSRVNFEKCITEEEIAQFKISEQFEIQTMLKERYKAFTSKFELNIDANGKLRSKLFPKETFEDIIRRGVEYRKQNGSPELEREEKELEGIIRIQDISTNPDTPIGTKYLLLSPPGIVENTTYTKRFVDYGELMLNEQGERKWEFTRFECGLSDDEYAQAAESIQPGFFENQKGPIDAWYLSNPIFKAADELPQSSEEIFNRYFKREEDTLDQEDMQEIEEYCMPIILYLVDKLTDKNFNPREIALTINTLLVKGDKKYKEVLAQKRGEYTLPTEETHYLRVEDEVKIEGLRYVPSVDAGCGESGGYDTSFGSGSQTQLLENSVGQFGMVQTSGEKKILSCTCPFCNQKVDAVIEGGRIKCPKSSCGKSAPYNC